MIKLNDKWAILDRDGFFWLYCTMHERRWIDGCTSSCPIGEQIITKYLFITDNAKTKTQR